MSVKPRILILSTAYLPLIGGSELAIHHISQRLTGYDFDLVTKRYSKEVPAVERIGRVRIFRVRSPKILLPLALALKAFRLSLRSRYSLVHVYQASHAGGASSLLKLLRPGMRVVLTLQEGKDLDKQPWSVRFFRLLIIRRADAITAISSYLADYARRYTKVPIVVIPNGVDLVEIARPPRNPDPTILTVSRLVYKNNIKGIIRALPFVRKSITNVRLAIVGDGPLRPSLEALSSQLGVREIVHFMGTIPHNELPAVYATADVFVRPSLSEGLGSAFLEAMAAGVPVVGSAVGGIPDFLHHEQTGLVCNPQSPTDIAAQIIRILTDSPLREKIASHAQAMVRERYDWNIVAKRMGDVYSDLVR